MTSNEKKVDLPAHIIKNPTQVFLKISRLTKKFGDVTAVDDINFSIEKGHVFALLGPSGCGKSTLLRMLAGFEVPTSGQMLLEGEEITKMPPYSRPINMMFQSYALFPHLSVWENIAFGLKREGQAKDLIAEQVEKMLQLVQMARFAKRLPHQLSGGQQQRVALARSLAKQPKLLLLDEPLGALDRKLREHTQWELTNIIKQVGVTCMLVTHDQEEAMTMADRMAVMNDGYLQQIGRPHEIYETPANRFVADFIGNVNLFEGKLVVDEPDHCMVDTAEVRVYIGHGITGNKGMAVTIAIRPEKIDLDHDLTPKEHNSMNARVIDYSYFGHFTVYLLETINGKRFKASYPNTEREGVRFKAGEMVRAYWANESAVVLTN